MAVDTSVPLLHARILWRPEQFDRCANGGFESSTSGWSVAAGINAAGTSITRITTDAHSGSACAELVTAATADSGANYDLGSYTFFAEASYGAVYAAIVWAKWVSGPRWVRLILGSEGTSSDRGTLVIPELSSDWRPYRVLWMPAGNRTDAQLAIVSAVAQATTIRIDDVAIYMPEAFSQIENGTFDVDTSGWSPNGGATLTRVTSLPPQGSGNLRIATTTTIFSGADYDLGGRTFLSGRTYRLRFCARTISGSPDMIPGLGDVGASDRVAPTTTLTADWEVYTLDWTPSADRTGVSVIMRNAAAAANTFEIDAVEVYEVHDELGTALERLRYRDGGSFDGRAQPVGTWSIALGNTAHEYDPRNASGALYGSVEQGKRFLVRAWYDHEMWPMYGGAIRTIEPDPRADTVTISGVDPLGIYGDAEIRQDFAECAYHEARRHAWAQALLLGQRPSRSSTIGSSRMQLDTGAIEGNEFWDGTPGYVRLAEYLRQLDAATGVTARIDFKTDANKWWVYDTTDRTTITSGDSDWTVDEDEADTIGDIDEYRLSHEAVENRQLVTWQAYERLTLPADVNFGSGAYTFVARAADAFQAETTYRGDADPHLPPYLTYTDDRIGDETGIPEPLIVTVRDARYRVYPAGRTPLIALAKPRQVVAYPDAFVPFPMALGDRHRRVVEFSVPVADQQVLMFDGTTAATVTSVVVDHPRRLEVETIATAADDIEFWGISGTPYVPLEPEQLERIEYDSVLRLGQRDGATVDSPFISSRGAAEGLGDYRNWRWSEARVRLRIKDQARPFPRALSIEITRHITLTADRWLISGLLGTVVGREVEVSGGGLVWDIWYDWEELPAHTDWLTLDDAAKGLDDPVVLAY
jgi:hypothetical protein